MRCTRGVAVAGALLLSAGVSSAQEVLRPGFGKERLHLFAAPVAPRIERVRGCVRPGAVLVLEGRGLNGTGRVALERGGLRAGPRPRTGHVHLRVRRRGERRLEAVVPVRLPPGAGRLRVGLEETRTEPGRWLGTPRAVAACGLPVRTLGQKVKPPTRLREAPAKTFVESASAQGFFVPGQGAGARGGPRRPASADAASPAASAGAGGGAESAEAVADAGDDEWGGWGDEDWGDGDWGDGDWGDGSWGDGDWGGGAPPGRPSGGFLAQALPAAPEPPPAPARAGAGAVEPREVLVASADIAEAEALAGELAGLGYRLRRRRVLTGLGMVLSVFRTPPQTEALAAAAELAGQYPDRWLDANHRYRPLAADGAPVRYARRLIGWRTVPACGEGLLLGLVDGAVDRNHPALRERDIEVDRAPLGVRHRAGGVQHATALAALLVGAPGSGFGGLLPAAQLRVEVVLRARDEEAVDATAEGVVTALDALVRAGAQAAVLSLGGPPNRLVELAVRRAFGQGLALAAAAGNGSGAEPVYPAAYPEVVGVTAVDADGRAWARAGRGAHVTLAAPGVDLWVAAPGGDGRYATGTSYAVPFAAAALALEMAAGRSPDGAARHLAQTARDLGAPGPDPVFGAGLLRHPGCGN